MASYLANKAPALVLLGLLLCGACTSRITPPANPESALRLPTKDEVARVNGRPLSLSAYYYIKSETQEKSPEILYWMGIASLALQNDAEARNISLSPQAALAIVRYATHGLTPDEAEPAIHEYLGTDEILLSPPEMKKQIEGLLSRALVQKNQNLFEKLATLKRS